MKNSAKKDVISTEVEMLKKLQEEKTKRANQCWSEINLILKKYNCILDPVIELSSGGLNTKVSLNAR